MGAESNDYDIDKLVEAFKCFCATPTEMTTKDCGKIVKTCWGVSLSNAGDIAYSKVKVKGQTKIPLNRANVKKYMELMAKEWKKPAKGKTAEVDLADKVMASTEKAKPEAKTSKTGGVDRLTDTSKYTGSHKERFDESGKGKGASGRQ